MSNIEIRPYLILLVVFVVTRIVLFSVASDDYLHRLPGQDDAPAYLKQAMIWKGDATFAELELSPFVRVPGYSWMLAGVGKVTGNEIGVTLILQQVMELAIIFLVYWWLAREKGGRWAMVMGVLLTLFFDFALYGFLIRSEIAFTLLILLAVLLFMHLLETWDWSEAMMVGLLLGLATLTRPISMLLVGPLILMLAWKWWKYRKVSVKKVFWVGILLIVVFAAILSPLIYRNWKLSGHFLLQQDTGNIIYMTYPGGHWQSMDVRTLVQVEGRGPLEVDRELTSLALKRMAERPDVWSKNVFKNFLFRLWSMGFTDSYLRYFQYIDNDGGYHKGDSLVGKLVRSIDVGRADATAPNWLHSYWVLNNVLGFSMIGWSLLSLVSWWRLPSKSRVIFGIFLYFWVMTSFFSFSGSRFMIPMVPLLFILIPDLVRVWLPSGLNQSHSSHS